MELRAAEKRLETAIRLHARRRNWIACWRASRSTRLLT
jgi:hypothetical protein